MAGSELWSRARLHSLGEHPRVPNSGMDEVEFRFEAFNIFNTVIYGPPVNDMADTANFGKVLSTANSPRQLQLGAKIIW